MPPRHLATFQCDVTPPVGHPLCGGWILPVRGVDDPLAAKGIVILGESKPIVICGLDWTGLRNSAFRVWRQALAIAAHTTPEHVVLHSVHPHNAPFADLEAEKLIAAANSESSLDLKFYEDCVARSAKALKASLSKAVPFTHVGHGSAEVKQVASNRRILGADSRVKFTRTSATTRAEIRDEPTGLIDPLLRTLSFWNDAKPLACLSFYACHPMSYYGDGRVSADFCGLAREKVEADTGIFQIYLNGCGGNVTAGKFNDGSKQNRLNLRDRIFTAMFAASKDTRKIPVRSMDWQYQAVKLPPRKDANFGKEQSRTLLNDHKATTAQRNNSAFQIAWLERVSTPIEISCLNVNGAVWNLFLPGEAFIEYQLAAEKLRPHDAVLVAAYGDGGPGYIPTSKAFLEGGYEPTVALTAPESEEILLQAIKKLLQA